MVLVIVVEEVTVMVDQEAMETKAVDMVAVVEDMMVTMKEEILEGLMLKLKLQYFGHLMRRTDSLEKT